MSDDSPVHLLDSGSARPRLRRDLHFTLHDSAHATQYVIEDPSNGRFFRIGGEEYAVLSAMDGESSIADLVGAGIARGAAQAFSHDEVLQICQWLWREGLLEGGVAGGARGAGGLQRYNPLAWRLRLGDPGAVLEQLYPWCRCLLSRRAALLWLLTVGMALYAVAIDPQRFAQSTRGVLVLGNAWWLMAVWVGLKVVHETAHGLVCRHFGGTAREAGLYWILFMPLAYVDVSNMWRFRSKWARIATAGAGMYAEVFVAALACQVWAHSAPGLVNHIAFNVVSLGGVASLFFNANPLMRFDGYHMLADYLEIPNLAARGQQCVRWMLRALWSGRAAGAMPRWPGVNNLLIAVYGVASQGWRMMVTVVLLIAASQLLAGLGWALVAIALLIQWQPRWRALRKAAASGAFAGPLGPAVTRLAIAVTLLAALLCLPWPGRFSAPAFIDYQMLTPLRAVSAGFVREVKVATGQDVVTGQVLLVLDNAELSATLAGYTIDLASYALRTDAARARGELAAANVIDQQLLALREKRAEAERQVAALTVIAPHAGRVLSAAPAALRGRYVAVGEELLMVADVSTFEVRASVAERDAERFRRARASAVQLELRDHGYAGDELDCELLELAPQATTSVVDQALTVASGGPLAVRAVERKEGRGYELLAPRFTARAAVRHAAALRAGQRGRLYLPFTYVPIARVLYRTTYDWLERLFEANRAAA